VLTDDALLVVTGVRARAVLTRIARADVRSVEAVADVDAAFFRRGVRRLRAARSAASCNSTCAGHGDRGA